MATTVGTIEEFTLYDETVVKVRPLPISRLKKAMAFMDEETSDAEAESSTAGLDFIFALAQICLKGIVPEDYDLEDNLDAPTAKRIIAVSTGVDFDDENLILAAATAAAQSGANST